jgi:hemerythrin superfamily protein
MTTSPGRSQDVLDLLVSEHRQVEELLKSLRAASDPAVKRELADEIIAQLVRHAVAEEAYVYPVVRDYIPNGAEAVEHDMEEHDELEHILKELEGLDPQDPKFDETTLELQTTLAHHIDDEEAQQFPQLRLAAPEAELVELVEKVQRIESLAPTRAHPNAPNSELFHKLVGPGVGMVDRLRDSLTGRLAS